MYKITESNCCWSSVKYFLLSLVFVCTACLPYGDILLSIKGNIKEPAIDAQKGCAIEIHQLNNLIASRNIVGTFEETFVFQPKSGDAFDIIVQCNGTSSFVYKVISIPKKAGEYIDLGNIALNIQ